MSRKVHLHFSDDIKKRWFVKKDSCGDEYIALNGKKALGKGGVDHIYLISEKRAGLWITSKQIKQKINNLKGKVSALVIEQLGKDEAVVSVPVEDLHNLCKAVKAKKHKHLNESQLQRLRAISPFLKDLNGLTKSNPDESQNAETNEKGAEHG